MKHPVHDFLFTYYSFSPAKLLDWQPGWPDSGTLELLERRPSRIAATLDLLRATAARPATYSCFGLRRRAARLRRPGRPLRERLIEDCTRLLGTP